MSTARQPVVRVSDVKRQIVPDDDPDTSYLEQDVFEERLASYRNGEFGYVGVRATVSVVMYSGCTHQITSAGLWGIEDDSGEDYFNEVFAEERNLLIADLEEMGFAIDHDDRCSQCGATLDCGHCSVHCHTWDCPPEPNSWREEQDNAREDDRCRVCGKVVPGCCGECGCDAK